jgi:hypothetical protein
MLHRSAIVRAAFLWIQASAPAASADDKPALTPYGFIRLDAIYDDSRMNHIQSAMWVESETDANRNDRELSLHPRLTRVGLRLEPVDVDGGTLASGVVEIDFQNGGRESRQIPRMRHGYAQLAFGGCEVLAGQTWDLVSPLFPSANNDVLMWNAGNTGDRRPQARLTLHPSGGAVKSRVAVAAGMPNAVNDQDLDANGQLDGLDAAFPVLQALAEVEGSRITLGVWGLYAQDRVRMAGELPRYYQGALVGGHFKVAPTSAVTLLGEVFWARNGTDFRAGIGNGINLTEQEEVETRGGWVELGVKPCSTYFVAAGVTIDAPHVALPSTPGTREQNGAFYLVQQLKPLDRVTLGLEVLRWRTLYVLAEDGDANRVNGYLSLSF